jgi:hypothetical protein
MTPEQFIHTQDSVLALNYGLGALMLLSLTLLGLLISLGNRRVEKAIATANRQLARWSAQDLRLKRGQAARQLRVVDPQVWLERLLLRVSGERAELVHLKAHPQADGSTLVALARDGRRWLLTPQAQPMARQGQPWFRIPWRRAAGRLQAAEGNPLLELPRGAQPVELSLLNAGLYFDLEAQQVWQDLLGQELPDATLYLYRLPAGRALG